MKSSYFFYKRIFASFRLAFKKKKIFEFHFYTPIFLFFYILLVLSIKFILFYWDYAVEEAMHHRMSHGGRVYDLRYQILRNFNWSLEEKRKLVYDFYEDEYDFMLHLDAFERKVIRHPANFRENNISLIELDKIYDYDLVDLENKYHDSIAAVEVLMK